jgi:hypothetical protein
MLVGGGEPGARVDHEQDHVAIDERCFRLRAHAPGKRLRITFLEACGVDDGERRSASLPSPSRRSRVTPGSSSTAPACGQPAD